MMRAARGCACCDEARGMVGVGPSLCSIANVEAGWREAPLCRA
jgi:hypothetical protein